MTGKNRLFVNSYGKEIKRESCSVKLFVSFPCIFFNKFHHKSNTSPALAKQQITVFHNQFAKNWI